MNDIDIKPTPKQIFDALTGSSIDGCDPDWCRSILFNAEPADVQKVSAALSSGRLEKDVARDLGIFD